MSRQVLHLDFIKLNPEAEAGQRSRLQATASQLKAIEGVLAVGVIEGETGSDFDVAFWFLLESFSALEPFGTDARYSQFLQGTVARLLTAFAGADVILDDDLAGSDGPAACLGLMGPEETYDFEVREALQAWAASVDATSAAIGVAVGERQQYRGAAIAFGTAAGVRKPETEPFRATLIRGHARSLA